ncbi:tripartite ATP-independent transporter DctP family solute receptor [Sphaerotilus hippei]|uniref:Tripartite ATP-independent transporter DctP family solute receptor n=1 Tax=Sphaerotilus hippei TaxID=744406 RepID=A0A318H2E8_9BURK|nr:TRAP transporter substrate-binding protein [Sphaerotilus hippei]PXW97413.1 tripartite ATP-independent transporter DctP family solute receptor [Sphaerotilus hippei]
MFHRLKSTVAAVLACGLLAAGATGAMAADIKERTLKFAMQTSAGSAQYDAALRFAELVKARSGGKLTVKVFGGGVLGKDVAVVSGMQGGTIEMCVMNSSLLAGVVKEMSVLDFPFVFASEKEAYSVVDGPFGSKLHALLEPKGLVGLSYWELGFRHFHNSKRPIAKLDDLQGLKIRVIETPIYVDFMNAMGANAIPLPYPELYTALEQKALDGGTQPVINMVNNKLYEVQKYFSMTGHMYNPQSVIFSKKVWDGYSADERKILQDAADEAREYQRQISRERNARGLEELKARGMVVNELPAADLARMKEKARPVVEKYTRIVGEPLVKDMFAAIDKARAARN